MRHVVVALLAASLAACTSTPRPFEHDSTAEVAHYPSRDKVEVEIGTPANMPNEMAERVAAALAIELQAYGVVAALQPTQAPLKIASAMNTRDAPSGPGIEIEIQWYLFGGKRFEGPAISKTVAQARDYAEATDWLVSRIAQQAAPRVATLMGRPPNFEPRAPGQVAAGITQPPPAPPPDAATTPTPGVPAAAAPAAAPRQVKVTVAPVVGAPSDGNRQLFSGMRRALGSSKLVVIDTPAADTFTVVGSVVLTPIDDRSTQLAVKWILKEPGGKEVGNVEQSNAVPLAATRGSWSGFGDIVAAAAVEGILELLDKALNKSR